MKRPKILISKYFVGKNFLKKKQFSYITTATVLFSYFANIWKNIASTKYYKKQYTTTTAQLPTNQRGKKEREKKNQKGDGERKTETGRDRQREIQ